MVGLMALAFIVVAASLKISESTRWPQGTYGLPKAVSGCPKADDFLWQEGWVSQDTNGENSNNSKSEPFYLDGVVDAKRVNRSFCLKTSQHGNRLNWPRGQYCVYKNGTCPIGMGHGDISWDDDNNVPNCNSNEGALPGGRYTYDTQIRFCCASNGDKDNPILLPTKDPFFLLAYQSAKCQMVQWAVASLQWIFYDTEHNENNDNARAHFPYNAGGPHPTIYYCYYRSCNETLLGLNGTFHSPNHPNNYSNGQYCSWKIIVRRDQQIHLVFLNFSLENEVDTDSLFVYDGENATSKELGVFYGGHPPPKEGLYSTSYKMFVIFKSDNTSSFSGFSAIYCESNCSETSGFTATTQAPEGMSTATPSLSSRETSTDITTTKERGGKGQKKQLEEKGLNMTAVVVPTVVLVFVVALLLAILYYCKRKRTKEDEKKANLAVVYSNPCNEIPLSVENACYERTPGTQPTLAVDNPYYDRGLYQGISITTEGCGLSEENGLYNEVNEYERIRTDNREDYAQLNNEVPMYETVESVSTAGVDNNIIADDQNSDGLMYETIGGEKELNPSRV